MLYDNGNLNDMTNLSNFMNDIANYRTILMPFNTLSASHWTLFKIDFDSPSIEILDPMHKEY